MMCGVASPSPGLAASFALRRATFSRLRERVDRA